MTLNHIFKTSLIGLETNKARSFLTILGIVIGITAIILITSVGKGAQNLILSQIQSLGSKTIVVIPGREPKGPTDPSIMETLLSDSLKEKDIKALQNKINVPNLAKIMPIVFGIDISSYREETYRLTIFGATDLITKMYDINPSQGTFFNDEDVKGMADVVIIGFKVKEQLFGNSDALGEKIKIKGRNFRVIGILPKKGTGSLINFDEAAFIPYTTAQQYIFGIKHYHRLVIEVNEEKNIEQVVKDIKATLRNSHGITDPAKDDFFIQTQADLIKTVSVITNILTLFLTAVAAISLLVGGVGIMNIMLVSVTERTREIGLRKAVGATENDILMQFLLEAIVLTVAGGIVGIILGGVLSLIFSIILTNMVDLKWPFSFPAFAAFLGLTVAALVGLVFGLYPARRAANMNPIEALKYE